MSISFHHHLRNGDYTLNMVMDEIAKMGIRELTVNASSIFDIHAAPLEEHIANHVVRKMQHGLHVRRTWTPHLRREFMDEPVEFRTHGGRPRDIAAGHHAGGCGLHRRAHQLMRRATAPARLGRLPAAALGYAFPDAHVRQKGGRDHR